MNYKKHYDKLIENAKLRSIIPTEYKEKHHIIPKCMGGSNEKENLVDLLPEEHLLSHLLLVKLYPDHHGLIYSAIRMSNYKKLTCKEYAWVKIRYSNSLKLNNKMSDVNREKLSKRQTENNIATRTDVRAKISQAKKEYYKNNPGPNNGLKASEETKKKQSIAATGRTGKNACRRKIFNLISPTGKIHHCEGTLDRTIRELGLSGTPLKRCKGSTVPEENRPQFNTEKRNNTTGWKLVEL
jgi:hypothetical protein